MDGLAKIVFAALLLPFGFSLVTTGQQIVILQEDPAQYGFRFSFDGLNTSSH